MKLFNFTSKSDYVKAKKHLIDYASNNNLHVLEVYKTASVIQKIDLERGNHKVISISSSIVFGSIVAALSVSIATKMLFTSTGVVIIVILSESFKNRRSIKKINNLYNSYNAE